MDFTKLDSYDKNLQEDNLPNQILLKFDFNNLGLSILDHEDEYEVALIYWRVIYKEDKYPIYHLVSDNDKFIYGPTLYIEHNDEAILKIINYVKNYVGTITLLKYYSVPYDEK